MSLLRSDVRSRLILLPLEDRLAPSGVQAEYAITQNWGSGFQGTITLTNETAAVVPFQSLGFQFPASITSIWDARITSQVGSQYSVTNAGWNTSIPVGGSVSFGFVASPGTTPGPASGFVLNGVPVDAGAVSPPVVPPPPVAPPVVPPPPVSPPPVASSGAVSFRATSDWGSGLTGEIKITNTGTQPISSWKVSFDLPGTIDSIWSANLESRVGNRYTVTPADWTKSIPVGGSITFGFNASPGRIAATNFSFTATGSTGGSIYFPPSPPAVPPVVPPVSQPVVPPSPPVVTPPPAATSAWPAEVFAPYVDATLWPTYDFVSTARNAGVKYFSLAFITADPQARPAWGGYAEYAITGTEFDVAMRGKIGELRGLGGDALISFGGAAGRELAEVITNVSNLSAAYRTVIDAYQLTHVDFDIEGGALAHRDSVDRRSQAIAALQQEAAAAGRELHVSFTLPVLPTGLTPDGIYLLESAKRYGVRVDVVNIMAMDYGDSAAPNPQGRMGNYAIQAGEGLFAQLTTVFGSTTTEAQRWRMVGITPMIGVNDVTSEVFDQQEAREVVAWAEAKNIGRLAMWSLNRDRQNPNGTLTYVDLFSSGVVQTPLEFSQIFNVFTG